MPQSSENNSLRAHAKALLRNPVLAVWALFLLLTPVYVFESGLPQPGDMLVFVLTPLALFTWNGRFERRSMQIVRGLLAFTLWVAAVNFGWALITLNWNREDYLIFPIFYVFNMAVFTCALVLARPNPERFLRITVGVVLVTVVYQVIASFVYQGSSYRGQVFFNSPNQLGFFAVLAACLIAMAQRPLRISRWMSAIGVTGCAYLALLSASRSALAGILALLFLLLFSSPRTIILASLAAIALTTLGGPISNAIDASQERALHDRDPKTGFIEERGLDRMARHPQYLLLGAGEGDIGRFQRTKKAAGELHNTFGSLIFSYGIVGFALFAIFFRRVIRGASARMTLMLVPVGVYALAHNGLRTTMMWMLFAFFVVLKRYDTPEARAAQAK